VSSNRLTSAKAASIGQSKTTSAHKAASSDNAKPIVANGAAAERGLNGVLRMAPFVENGAERFAADASL
jgi:hypothetical protein